MSHRTPNALLGCQWRPLARPFVLFQRWGSFTVLAGGCGDMRYSLSGLHWYLALCRRIFYFLREPRLHASLDFLSATATGTKRNKKCWLVQSYSEQQKMIQVGGVQDGPGSLQSQPLCVPLKAGGLVPFWRISQNSLKKITHKLKIHFNAETLFLRSPKWPSGDAAADGGREGCRFCSGGLKCLLMNDSIWAFFLLFLSFFFLAEPSQS